MTTWTQQLTATSGDFTPILSTITQADGECLQAIYDSLKTHSNDDLYSYVVDNVCVYIEKDGIIVNLPSIGTLKAVGLIISNDNNHIGLTPLGYGFMQTMLNT